MKLKNFYLFTVLITLLVSTNLCLAWADDNTVINRQVFAKSTFLSYKNVKDNFGKKFAKSFFVVQVDIRNENEDKQFIVQTIDVFIDPLQCEGASKYFQSLTEGKDKKTPTQDKNYKPFSEAECRELFDRYFYVPGDQPPIRSEEVLASGKADLNRSNRNIGFRLLAFTANMGTILTGFHGLIGRDGILGINVLGTTATAAANVLFPNTADAKLENLKNALPPEDILIKSKESKTFNIFIPTERVFWKDSWKEYIKSAQESNYDTYKLKKVLDLILLSSATGVLVNNNAPKVEAQSEDKFRRQTEKIGRIGFTDAEISNIDLYGAKMELIEANLNNSATEPTTTASLRDILAELKKVPDIETALKTTLATKDINTQSTGKEIFQAIRTLTGVLREKPNGNELQQKVRDVVIAKAR